MKDMKDMSNKEVFLNAMKELSIDGLIIAIVSAVAVFFVEYM